MNTVAPTRPLGVAALALIEMWNGFGSALFSLFSPVHLAGVFRIFYPVPAWITAAESLHPVTQKLLFVCFGVAEAVLGLGLWRLKRWARVVMVAVIAIFLIVPNCAAIAIGPPYYPTFGTLWARLLFHGAFAIAGLLLVRYLMSPTLKQRFSSRSSSSPGTVS